MNVGWREWADLPGLNIYSIRVKIDTGAKTSALHARHITPFDRDGEEWVRFSFPADEETSAPEWCEAPIKDRRQVMNSGGEAELRYVIETDIMIGGEGWHIEVTLTNRDNLKYNMLLGRQGMTDLTVIPSRSYIQPKTEPGKTP